MRSKYFDPIEHFPEKIDQLLDALNRARFIYYWQVMINFSLQIYIDQQIRKPEITSGSSVIRRPVNENMDQQF